MGSISSFGHVVKEILLKNYLKTNSDIVPTFPNFIRGKSSKINHLFFEL